MGLVNYKATYALLVYYYLIWTSCVRQIKAPPDKITPKFYAMPQ